jgi:hypothetical protein
MTTPGEVDVSLLAPNVTSVSTQVPFSLFLKCSHGTLSSASFTVGALISFALALGTYRYNERRRQQGSRSRAVHWHHIAIRPVMPIEAKGVVVLMS